MGQTYSRVQQAEKESVEQLLQTNNSLALRHLLEENPALIRASYSDNQTLLSLACRTSEFDSDHLSDLCVFLKERGYLPDQLNFYFYITSCIRHNPLTQAKDKAAILSSHFPKISEQMIDLIPLLNGFKPIQLIYSNYKRIDIIILLLQHTPPEKRSESCCSNYDFEIFEDLSVQQYFQAKRLSSLFHQLADTDDGANLKSLLASGILSREQVIELTFQQTGSGNNQGAMVLACRKHHKQFITTIVQWLTQDEINHCILQSESRELLCNLVEDELPELYLSNLLVSSYQTIEAEYRELSSPSDMVDEGIEMQTLSFPARVTTGCDTFIRHCERLLTPASSVISRSPAFFTVEETDLRALTPPSNIEIPVAEEALRLFSSYLADQTDDIARALSRRLTDLFSQPSEPIFSRQTQA